KRQTHFPYTTLFRSKQLASSGEIIIMDEKKLSHMQKDVLREIGNIGAGNAATSMSQLINKDVTMEVPSVKVVSINEMMEEIGGPDRKSTRLNSSHVS